MPCSYSVNSVVSGRKPLVYIELEWRRLFALRLELQPYNVTVGANEHSIWESRLIFLMYLDRQYVVVFRPLDNRCLKPAF